MPDGQAPGIIGPREIPLSKVQTIGELLKREEEVSRRLSAVATRHLSAERAMRLAINAVRNTKNLAACDPASFLGALMSATGLGLEPNTPKQHAFLIPYKQPRPRRDQNGNIVKDGDGRWIWDEYYECQFQIGYKGFIALFYRSGIVVEATAEAIREGDKFEHQKGTETFLRYEKSLGKRGELLGAFAFTRLRDGQSFTVLPLEEIEKIRSRSRTWQSLCERFVEAEVEHKKNPNNRKLETNYKKAKAALDETPWVMWVDEMAAKSAVRRHAKQQDLGDEAPAIAVAADLDALGDAGTIDIRAMADPEFAKEVVQGDEQVEPGNGGDEDVGEPRQIQYSGEAPLNTVPLNTVQRERELARGEDVGEPAHLRGAPPIGEAEPVDTGPQRMETQPGRRRVQFQD
ncbi:MAG: recombinase RecT [Alphaproteobacteria bacterium]